MLNALTLVASAFPVALGLDAAAIAVALLWLPFSRLLYALTRRVTPAAGTRFKHGALYAAGGGLGLALLSGAVLAAGVKAAGMAAAAGGAILVLALVATAVGHLVIDKPAVSGRASIAASGAIAALGGVMGLLMLDPQRDPVGVHPRLRHRRDRMTLTYPIGTPLAKTQAASTGSRPQSSRSTGSRRPSPPAASSRRARARRSAATSRRMHA